MREPLPIDPLLPEIAASLRSHSALVLRAPTGAGKTTRVAPALLATDVAREGAILLLEPRRLAARAAAGRMAQERGERVGETVGYQVRFERRLSERTRIQVLTPGILLRRLHDDPFLEGCALVLFDEFHERSLENDLALGMVRLLQQTVRPDLRLGVMSATLPASSVAHYLGNCPVLTCEGRLFPVEIRHEPRSESQPWPRAVARAVQRWLPRTSGDLLVFLPGLQEIRQTMRELRALAEAENLLLMPLHGDLPAEQQDAALLPQSRRKVILATNVAETSVTVEGVTAVIDTGLARILRFDPHVGLDRLRVTPIAQASAEQRAGRAGRTQPGVCVRLWSETSHRGRAAQTESEILRVDLAGAILQLLTLGETNLEHFPWLEPPPLAAVEQGIGLLRRLGVINEQGVTALGHTMARLPLHPRLARLLLEGQRLGQPERVALAAALLSERDPFSCSVEELPGGSKPQWVSRSDVLDRVESLMEYEKGRCTGSARGVLHRGAARHVLLARDQLLRSLPRHSTQPLTQRCSPEEGVLRALLAAFPDRLARRRKSGSRRGVMVGGRGVRLAASSGVLESELFLCIDVDAGTTETLVRQASAVQRDWLPADQLQTRTEVIFDAEQERVLAVRRLHFADLLLEETPAHFADEAQAAQVLLEAARTNLARVLPPAESPATGFLKRVRWLREWLPELNLPAFDEAELKAVLGWLVPRCRSFADLRRADWFSALQGKLTYDQQQVLAREAPERLEVPSGSRLALHYEPGRAPILAVRIQEVFGLRETPRLAAGRVRILLHLLAPNHRPQQVTEDLASFWANTYPLVRKELRARYPRHAWPEDPWNAPAERHPRRNRTN